MATAERGAPEAGFLRPPGRQLAPDELAAWSLEIACREELWWPLACFDGEERKHRSLYVDEHIGIWVISWMPGHDTGFHDHDESCGGVAVAHGRVREERPRWGREPHRIDPCRGESFCFDDTEIHRMVNVGDEPAVTIHSYSVPLKRMGIYSTHRDGQLCRRAVPWDETLEPE
ncbi:MAG: cysteine dioxygenase family protein [Actinomycetota bacterium]|nr:cysteine dioxygenase family protein [Actinomycetota bacterium]